MKNNPKSTTPSIIRQNVHKYNINNATFHQFTGSSRDETIIKGVMDLEILQKPSNSNTNSETNSETGGDMDVGLVDFLFIDGDHFNLTPDFTIYQKLVREGGIIMFDDYGHHKNVIWHVNKLIKSSGFSHCYHIIGQVYNYANATHLNQPNLHFEYSNEFIIQKKYHGICKFDF